MNKTATMRGIRRVSVLLAPTIMMGCASTSVSVTDTPQKVAADVAKLPEVVDWTDANSTLFGFPQLEKKLLPLVKRCELTGAVPVVDRESFTFKPTQVTDMGKAVPGPRYAIQRTLVSRVTCPAPAGQSTSESWAIEIGYRHQYKWFMAGENKLMDIWIRPTYVSGDELAQRAESKRINAEYAKLRQDEAKAAARQQERDMAEYIQRKNAERLARAPAFRQNLKVGDRARLANSGEDSAGLVVEIKRPLALVQFDRMTVNNEAKRWVNIDSIEPEK